MKNAGGTVGNLTVKKHAARLTKSARHENRKSTRSFFLFNQLIQFKPQLSKDLVVRECAEGFAFSLEVDSVRAAPQAKIGVVGFAGAIDSATHDGNGDGVVFGIRRHLLHLLREFNKGFVLDAGAAWARNDVELRRV